MGQEPEEEAVVRRYETLATKASPQGARTWGRSKWVEEVARGHQEESRWLWEGS